MRLSNIRLLVSDFDGCFRFYRDVLGMPVGWGEEGSGYASFDAGGGLIALFLRQTMADTVGTQALSASAPAQDRVAIILSVENLDETVAELRARGASFVTEPQDRPDWGIRTTHLRDPDGNVIELFAAMPESKWSDELKAEAEGEAAR